MKDHFDLRGKVALITGGSRGLGRAMAFAFAERGARLVIASRKLEQVEETAEALRATGAEVLGLACHVADWDQCDALFDAAIAHYGRVDILVNNAGMSPLYPDLESVSEALFDKVVGVNLKGP
ncbi:MAG: SDR family NAD(P)-dependent oxidoreductase, partial [Pseudomonadales bacterium]